MITIKPAVCRAFLNPPAALLTITFAEPAPDPDTTYAVLIHNHYLGTLTHAICQSLENAETFVRDLDRLGTYAWIETQYQRGPQA
jgi:hypothetical protein